MGLPGALRLYALPHIHMHVLTTLLLPVCSATYICAYYSRNTTHLYALPHIHVLTTLLPTCMLCHILMIVTLTLSLTLTLTLTLALTLTLTLTLTPVCSATC